jgi:hypothetical protein
MNAFERAYCICPFVQFTRGSQIRITTLPLNFNEFSICTSMSFDQKPCHAHNLS